ncbi:hypothetical protein EUTSA_v10013127mg [Eutrema salsugineum]|uniref:Uncharacterized protein n=1 Tax=Eutrema salsugineum TaxID=72664 RepID=V4LDD0_EUTSA|nr:uncharacterized protein LOC18018684 [Eutrema salsugineum]ESQ41699.1 hypothetical protein EUTSA_v10013127mg [Eutrema salsugineum]
MDFHSLLRRDLQFLCKRNKIPANMTNLAMADALKALDIVEGLNEYMNQSDSNVLQSPTSVAKQPPSTATRTTRRKTAIKAEPQSSSQLGNRSCHMTSKSLAITEMDQETINKNVSQQPDTNIVKSQDNVAKTPAARSTRKALAATSCSSKVQESKKDVLVQSVYSTRRSTRLLEKCMADLSLKTKETSVNDKPEKNEETEQKVSAQEKIPADSEERSEDTEVIPGRDLSASMEKEWKMLKNDSDKVTGGLEKYVDLGDTDAKNETNNEKMNEVMIDEKESEDSLVQVDKLEEASQADKAICEGSLKKNENEPEIRDVEVHVDLGDNPVLEYANTDTNNDNKEWKNDQAFNSLLQADYQETIQEIGPEPEKINSFDEDQTDGDGGDSETEPEEDNSDIDSDGNISDADSTQAVLGSDTAVEEMNFSESEGSAAAPISPHLLLEEATVKTAPLSPHAAEPISVQFPRPNKSTTTTPPKKSAMKLVNVDNKNKENNMEKMMNVNDSDNGEWKGAANKKKKEKVEIDAEKLKDVSMRQLVKMVKELSIKSSNNRNALQILPGNNNQIAE